jgi:hypothetical protein
LTPLDATPVWLNSPPLTSAALAGRVVLGGAGVFTFG